MDTGDEKRIGRDLKRRYQELDDDFKKSELMDEFIYSQILQVMMREEIEKGRVPADHPMEKFKQDLEVILSREEREASSERELADEKEKKKITDYSGPRF